MPLRPLAWLAPARKLILLPCLLDGETAFVIDGLDDLQGDKAPLTIAGEVLLAGMSRSYCGQDECPHQQLQCL